MYHSHHILDVLMQCAFYYFPPFFSLDIYLVGSLYSSMIDTYLYFLSRFFAVRGVQHLINIHKVEGFIVISGITLDLSMLVLLDGSRKSL